MAESEAEVRGVSLWKLGLQAVGGALASTLAVRWVSMALVEIPPEFPPLAGPGATIFFTAVCGTVAVGVFGLVRRYSKAPRRAFRLIAAVVLLISFVPDLMMLSDGAAATFPGATPAGVAVLMLLHVAAAVVIVWVLTRPGGAAGPD